MRKHNKWQILSSNSAKNITNKREYDAMAVEQIGEKYVCNICGNEVIVTKVGGGTLVCCGQDMERIKGEPPEVIQLPDAGG